VLNGRSAAPIDDGRAASVLETVPVDGRTSLMSY
jgi:hypothetical protein